MITIIFDQFLKTLKKPFTITTDDFLSLWISTHIHDRYIPYLIMYVILYITTTVWKCQLLQMAALYHCPPLSHNLYITDTLCTSAALLPLEKCGWCYNCNKLVSWPVSDNNSHHGQHLAPWCHSAFYCFRGRAGQDNYYNSRLFVDWSVFLLQAILCLILRSNTSHTRP